jgi:Copper transport outer membrane protein, MctB
VDARTDLPTADLALVVAPPASAPHGSEPAGATPEAWVDLARALDEASQGVVVAGDRSGIGTGVLAAVRDDAQASTIISSVDVAEMPSGQVAVVLALDEQSRGAVGHYGLGGAVDGPLPLAR